jgi:hypothetical protein
MLKIALTCLILFAKTCGSLREVSRRYSVSAKQILAHLFITWLYCTATLLRTALFLVIMQNSAVLVYFAAEPLTLSVPN